MSHIFSPKHACDDDEQFFALAFFLCVPCYLCSIQRKKMAAMREWPADRSAVERGAMMNHEDD